MTDRHEPSAVPSKGGDTIRVGLTEAHGVALEISQFPAPGVGYSFLSPLPSGFRLIRSPIKGYYRRYEAGEHDLIEAVLSPVKTESRWIYSVGNFIEAAAFNLLGLPLPRNVRVAYLKTLLLRDNFKKLIFWSNAGRDTLTSYGRVHDKRLLEKAAVVYPAIREVPDRLVASHDDETVNILFSGDFFRKGGVNTIDAFERAQRYHPSIRLRVCCDEAIDFNTPDAGLRAEYLEKIRRNDRITLGRVPRRELIDHILPRTDIYVMPTYVEVFGYALLEAMAFGIPVISTAHNAIPEMVEHGRCGFLVETDQFNWA